MSAHLREDAAADAGELTPGDHLWAEIERLGLARLRQVLHDSRSVARRRKHPFGRG
jgi:hypothetical protein